MKTLALSTASRSLAEYANELDDEVVLLTKRNRPVAAIVPLRNVDRETLALSTHPGFIALIERSRRQVAAGKTLSLEEMRAALKRRGRTSRSRRRRKARRA
jgi:prevent-host-death family protein